VGRGGQFGALRQSEQVEVEFLLLGEADEVPLIGERTLVVPCQLLEHQPPSLADTERLLEQIDERLRR
jgi:hypothetical protein